MSLRTSIFSLLPCGALATAVLVASGLGLACSSSDSAVSAPGAESEMRPGFPSGGSEPDATEAKPVAPWVPSPNEGEPPLGGIAGAPSEPPSETPSAGGGLVEPVPKPVTPAFDGGFIMGADISSIPEAVDAGSIYVDTDGQEKSMLALLAHHGFNYVRLRTFVDPLAAYGYGSDASCPGKAEAYADKAHTVEFAREVKAAGMGLLLDFHYSDTWADPGKQVIPEAWRDATTVADLGSRLKEYTKDVVTSLANAGARPDMVQIGNEITPGMLLHVPDADTDCWGNGAAPSTGGVTGSSSNANWGNLAQLLLAGIQGA